MKTSIRAKIMIFSAVLLLCISAMQLFFGLFLSKEFFVVERKSQMANLFDTIKSSYSDDAFELSRITEIGENIHNIKITVFDDEGIVYSTRQSGDGFEYFGQPFFFNKNIIPPDNTPPLDFSRFSENPDVVSSELQDRNLVLQGRFEHNGTNRYVLLSSSVESIEPDAT